MAKECGPLAEKLNAALEMLKQPSTIKGLIALGGLCGWTIAPLYITELLGGVTVLIGLVNIFYDANPRKSVDAEK